jgi:hypothetical protein
MKQQELKKLLFYYEPTGDFYWLQTNYQNGIKAGTKAGTIKSNGYVMITINCKMYYAHRLIWLYIHGYFPENQIDHINKKPNDNRLINLREISRQCNLRNSKVSATNKTGIKGIGWDKINCKWKVQITVNYKVINLGRYIDFNEAVCIRLAAEQCLGWAGCDSNSSAYQYVKKYIIQKIEK